MSMRPGSIDEVIVAYTDAVRERRDIEDRLRGATGAVARLTAERDAKTKLIRELRQDVLSYTGESEVAA